MPDDDMPADPFGHPVALWDKAQRGDLLFRQLIGLGVEKKQTAVYEAIENFDAEDLAAIVLERWITYGLPHWREFAETQKEPA